MLLFRAAVSVLSWTLLSCSAILHCCTWMFDVDWANKWWWWWNPNVRRRKRTCCISDSVSRQPADEPVKRVFVLGGQAEVVDEIVAAQRSEPAVWNVALLQPQRNDRLVQTKRVLCLCRPSYRPCHRHQSTRHSGRGLQASTVGNNQCTARARWTVQRLAPTAVINFWTSPSSLSSSALNSGVLLYACVSCLHISWTRCPNFVKFSTDSLSAFL